MYPYILILNKTIPTYGLMLIIGFIFSFVYLNCYIKYDNRYEKIIEEICIYSAIGTFIGSKILYLIVSIKDILIDVSNKTLSIYELLIKYTSGGFVFYGGLYGFVITIYLYSKKEKFNFYDILSILLPCFTILHAFGRIGCFLSGCCYGIESDIFGIKFSNSLVAPNDVKLIPTQLIESIYVFLLSFILIKMILRNKNPLELFNFYLFSYSIFRFLIEFLRGDICRGFIGVLSVSQLLSIINVIITLILSRINIKTKNV